ncbi:MAG: hypothetical protein HUJ25_18360 [Crocinitomicaceae bacterium]|nr:hypothetical protein [Crocinitomicaceae bacterium]
MKKNKLILLLLISSFFLAFSIPENNEHPKENKTPPITTEDNEKSQRFLNVASWKGEVTVSYVGMNSGSQDDYRITKNVHFEQELDFVTDEGQKQMMDPLNTTASQTNNPYGVNMEDLQNGTVDPTEMMEQMKVSMDSYKMWTADPTMLPESSAKTVTEIKAKKNESWVNSIEGCANCCEVNLREDWTSSHKANIGTIMISVNTKDNVYGFMSSSSIPEGAEFKHRAVYNPNNCEKTGHTYENVDEMKSEFPDNFLSEKPGEIRLTRLQLPQEGLVLMGSSVIDTICVMEEKDGIYSKKNIPVQVSWIFYPSDMELPEATLEIDDKTWIPEPDKSVGVKLSWENVTPSEIRFTLADISAEPGECLNDEVKDSEKPDLEIHPEMKNQGFVITQDGSRVIATKKSVSSSEEELLLLSHDYGAYGDVTAEIKVDGVWYPAKNKDDENRTRVDVPFDDNQNFIADEWEKLVGVLEKGYPDEWDEDPFPEGQDSPGDGFTLYEEYRGFKAISHTLQNGKNVLLTKDHHFRMDPRHKDVFVYDQDGLFKKYYTSQNPAELNWHCISPKNMKKFTPAEPTSFEHRWINYNTSEKHYFRKQYAMYVKSWSDDNEQGIANSLGKIFFENDEINRTFTLQQSVCSNYKRPDHPLRCRYVINISPSGIHKYVKNLDVSEENKAIILEKLMENTVIHEVGHGLGIREHFDFELDDDTNKSRESGVLSCFMRYDKTTNDKQHPKVVYMDHYCKKGEKWTVVDNDSANDPNYSGPIQHQEYDSHDCWGQINVKGDL